ncbi:phosphate acetyltransferase [Liquorilactobacillus sucicola DSM 21376 = JCM 15457]|uniref:Phosphate acetyltransferase n=1 Tax=Liquorilactobacillus sucicola DSM 21376 = JCM 15457 TaxID=1423806 RepID=A0A023CVN7_9LACO|nr:phosphate acetyltransferase [Liquorilactobacillus sucicola]KRN06003.1 phosphate acetyltransferase [Liquorilactobacillus sucicola DSM 21376 = JCM 15457]GAJ25927.1 phosphate acetyltransferase [Liquorilactobacillus sucicola DSM 21376 = JCM 15457]
MDLFESLIFKIKGQNKKIVFPEGDDERVVGAAIRLANDGLVKPIVLGKAAEIKEAVKKSGRKMPETVTIIDPEKYPIEKFQEMVKSFLARRKGKNTEEQAQKMLKDVNYFGTMLVYMDIADGLVSGAVHPTGDTVRPALQIIKTKPGISRTSGAFVMTRKNERYLFADCAININPNAQELAEIAVASTKTARLFDIDPKVAMLSFSTKGSAKSDEVKKVAEATKIAQELAPDEEIDGELQFDAAFVPSVGQHKAPGSKVAGHSNVFVFPELEAGNIGYKIAQRLGNFEAIGPILQGLNKPVSDLSRGANEEDVYKVAIITALQALD